MQNETRGSGREAEQEVTLDLNFVPQWARRPPDAVRMGRFDEGASGSRGDGHRRPDRGGERSGGEGDRRAPRREDDRRRRREPVGGDPKAASAPRERAPFERPVGGGGPVEAPRRPASPAPSPSAPALAPVELPLHVRFLPERKPLSDLIRLVSSTCRAYPLLDLASLLMAKEGCCYVKIEVLPEAKDLKLFQCKHCNTLALSQAAIESHVFEKHMETLFDVQEETVDAPAGVFVCVAKCGYSGILLGPRNHHSYTEAVKRVHAERFATMDFDAYVRHIQTSHAPEDVERWKTECSKRVVYRLKSAGAEAEPMTWLDAQRYMRMTVIPDSVASTRKAVLTEQEAHGIEDPDIRRTLRVEWQEETRFPIHLAFALRAAFRHRGLHLFKTGRGQSRSMNFVTAVKPSSLNPEAAIPEIRDALLFMKKHPGCTRKDMVTALRPDADPESDEVKALLQPIHWLVAKGHIIEFFNGTLSIPMGH